MGRYEPDDDRDVERLLGDLEQPLGPTPEFRASLNGEMRARLARRRGVGGLPEGWTFCPFDTFCVAEQRLPRALRANCPCLHAAPLLRVLTGTPLPVRARPCEGLRLRAEARVST